MSVEQLFFNRNVTTAISVGQARGVVLLTAANRGLPVMEFTPIQVKQAVVALAAPIRTGAVYGAASFKPARKTQT